MENPIEPYKPQVSIFKAFVIDEKLDDAALTFDVFRKLVTARKTQDLVFLSIGHMLKVFRDRKLYKQLDFDNFSQFLASEEVSFSREKAYLYIRTYELYVEKLMLDPDEIGKMGVVRLMMMAPVLKNMSREDAVKEIESKKDMRYGDFVREVKQQTNKDGKPTVYFSEEHGKWNVNYFENTTILMSLGQFEKEGQ